MESGEVVFPILGYCLEIAGGQDKNALSKILNEGCHSDLKYENDQQSTCQQGDMVG